MFVNIQISMNIQMPENVKKIIRILRDAGYEAYAVGGCVRDSLLGRSPHDWDITTSALPKQVKALFRRTVDTGIVHGTVTVMLGREGYEVTTYRVDGIYEDGRHPKQVTFTGNLVEDLKRRDFTINAMAYNEEQGLVDAFGGVQDLERGVIRCVGDPDERFSEDALRILRAVRFAGQLGFSVEDKTREAIRGHAERLRQVSAERIREELIKLAESRHPEYLRLAWETGITAVVLPEFDRMMDCPQHNPHHRGSVGEHTLWAMQAAPADRLLRLTMLLHDCAKPLCVSTDENGVDHFYGHGAESARMARQILRRLRCDGKTIDQVGELVYWHDSEIRPGVYSVRRAASRIGTGLFPMLLKVKQADLDAQSDYQREEKQVWLDRLKEIYEQICRDGDCLTLKELAVDGRDLMEAGIRPGPEMGKILQKLLVLVLEDPSRNRKEYLLGSLPKET